jgi:hypothetical protein
MPRSFLGSEMQTEYLHAMANPPKRIGDTNSAAYVRAYMYTAIGAKPMADQIRPPRNTQLYAWWRAGVDTAVNDLSRVRTNHGSACAYPLLRQYVNDNDAAPFGHKYALQRSFGEFGVVVMPGQASNDNEMVTADELRRMLDSMHETPDAG